MSAEERVAHNSLEACQNVCVSLEECIQYSYKQGECRIGNRVRLGGKADAMRSGWMTERIATFKQKMEGCEPVWITPDMREQWSVDWPSR